MCTLYNGWSEVKTLQQKIASTRECSNATTKCRVSAYPYIIAKARVTVSSIVFVGVLSQGSVGLPSLVYKPSHDSYWCSTFAITFTYAFHPEVIQGHANCPRQNCLGMHDMLNYLNPLSNLCEYA